MDKKKEIFEAFVKANGLEKTPYWKTHGFAYSGLNGQKNLTHEQIIGTVDFAGFSDGYEDLPHKYKGAFGTPEHEMTNTDARAFFEKKGIPLKDDIDAECVTDMMALLIPANRYDTQYTLGKSCRKY